MILDDDRSRRSRSATASASSGRTAPARRRCCGSIVGPRRARQRRGLAQARPDDRPARPGGALRRGLHGRRPTSGRRSAPARRTSSGWPRTLAALRARRPRRRARLRGPPARVRRPRRLHARPARRRGAERPRVRAATNGRKPPAAMSGGEQTRASLARLVIADPDLLLLDEPTNHLDLDALEWLEDHLRKRRGSLLVASHDRAFLDATVTRIWELRDRRLTAFRGDYSAYHRQREERDARAVKDADITRRVDRPRARAGPALPEPPQVLEDARARGPPRAAPGREAGGPEGRPQARDPERRRSPAPARPGRARSSSASRASRSGTCRAAAR